MVKEINQYHRDVLSVIGRLVHERKAPVTLVEVCEQMEVPAATVYGRAYDLNALGYVDIIRGHGKITVTPLIKGFREITRIEENLEKVFAETGPKEVADGTTTVSKSFWAAIFDYPDSVQISKFYHKSNISSVMKAIPSQLFVGATRFSINEIEVED